MTTTEWRSAADAREPGSASAAQLHRMALSIRDEIVSELYPAMAGDAEFRSVMTEFVHCAMTTISAIDDGKTDITPAARAPEFGRWLAGMGIPVETVRDTYWSGVRKILDQWAANRWAGPATEFSGMDGIPVERITRFTRAAFDFTERAVGYATEAHDEATRASRLSGDLRRRDLVLDLLDNRCAHGRPDLDTALGYRLSSTHVSVLVDTPDREQAERILRLAQRASGAREVLLVPLAPPR